MFKTNEPPAYVSFGKKLHVIAPHIRHVGAFARLKPGEIYRMIYLDYPGFNWINRTTADPKLWCRGCVPAFVTRYGLHDVYDVWSMYNVGDLCIMCKKQTMFNSDINNTIDGYGPVFKEHWPEMEDYDHVKHDQAERINA